jgi:hypothetical protein
MEQEQILSIIGYLLVSLAAVTEAIMDKIQFHYDKSIFCDKSVNQLFWDPRESWKNKWKADLKTEKFLGSSTIFVFTTDAWHLFKFFKNTFLFIGLPLITFSEYVIVFEMVMARIVYGITFTIYFDKILSKKQS